MSIAPWRLRRNAITVDKLLEIELLKSRIEGAGWMKDSVMVLVINHPALVLYVSVARGDDGYYCSVDYETPSGGAHAGVYKRGEPYPTKIEALRGAIKKKLDDYWIIKHPGNRERMESALREINKYEYQQLTLF